MNIDFSRKYCPDCMGYVRAEKKKASNIFHFIMTIITCGAWIFIWIMQSFSLSLNPWQCPVCGSKKLTSKPRYTPDGRERLAYAVGHELASNLAFFLILGIILLLIIALGKV